MSVWTKFDPSGKPNESWPPSGGLVLLRTPFGFELGYWRKPSDINPYVNDELPPEHGCWYDEHSNYSDRVEDRDVVYWAPIPEFDA